MLSLFSPSLFLLSLAAFNPVAALWPIPQNITTGDSVLFIDEDVQITYNGDPLYYIHGYVPNNVFDGEEIVQGAVSRVLSSILSSDFVPWMLHPKNELSEFEPDLYDDQTYIKTLQIVQTETDNTNVFKPVDGTVDESYNLTLSEDGSVQLAAVSSTGVLRGLESFSQLFYRHSSGPYLYTPYAPVSIQDAPRYSHRGILLDVARSFYPVDDILRTLDAMSWSKLNRLHIHSTDAQSWPLDIPALPNLSLKGAYRPDYTYSPADVVYIQKYGIERGIEVYFEIDMPGHTSSIHWSYPELITAYNAFPYYYWCSEPPCGALRLNDSAVEDFLGTLFDDLLPRVAPYSSYFHTGGDELNANDSMLDPTVRSNATDVLQPLLQTFIDTQHARVRKAGLIPMVWEEIPLTWDIKLGNDTVVQTWLGSSSVDNLTAQGYHVVDSNYNFYYLDCGRGQWLNFANGLAFETFYPFNDWCSPTKNWRLIYSYDPAANLTEEQAKLVLGGEMAIWGETIDPVTLDSLLWPRASAAGEILWSGRQDAYGQNRSQLDAAPRLQELRQLMLTRGVSAAPITNFFCTQAPNSTVCSYPM